MSEELRNLYIRGQEELNIILNNIQNDYEQRGIRNPIEHKKTRLKSDESILEKLKRKNRKEYNDKEIIENINDVIGARIVCPFLSDVEVIKERLKENPNLIFIDEKDFISNPKKSGYRSYHMRVLVRIVRNNKVEYVKAEIQVRTILMDMWASLEHKLSYKKGINFSSETEKEIIDLASLCQELDEDLDKKKTDEKKKNNEFKDILTPEEYDRITQKYKVAQEFVMTEINDIYKTFKNNEIDKKEVNPIEHIETRMKPADSLVRKLYKKMKESIIVNIDESISDIAGVRIVCSFERD